MNRLIKAKVIKGLNKLTNMSNTEFFSKVTVKERQVLY
jgi:hypothetical protein